MTMKDRLRPGVTIREVLARLARDVARDPWNFVKRGALVRERLPQLLPSILGEAQDCLHGRMVLPGSSQPHFVGNPPLWRENPFGHNEYTFHLNRMNHWLPMLQAWAIEGDESYPRKVVTELLDWIESCPRPALWREDGTLDYEKFNGPALREWRVLECGIRPYRTWAVVLEALGGTPLLTPDVLEKVLTSLCEQAEVTYQVSPRAWPRADHNHYIMENLGLLCTACLFPELRDAALWREHAVRELGRCMENQVGEEGGQIEGCPSYHHGSVFWFSMVIVYARRFGFELPQGYHARFRRMFEHSIYVTRPCGVNAPWGDGSTTGGIAQAAVSTFMALGNEDVLRIALHFVPGETLMKQVREQIWRAADPAALLDAAERSLGNAQPPPLVTMRYERSLGHVYMRTGWEREALSVLFACRSPVQNLHAHIDPCGFDFTAFGMPLVVDPGKYTYRDDENRRRFKSSAWHSMLTVNGRDAWEYIASWKYGPQKPGCIVGCGKGGAGWMYAVGRHENYTPVVHTRCIALGAQVLVLIDRLEGLKAGDTVQVRFHLDTPRACVDLGTGSVRGFARDEPCATAAVSVSCGALPTLEPAKVSDTNDIWRDSVLARFDWSAESADTALLASVVVPARAGEQPCAVRDLCAEWTPQGACVRFLLDRTPYCLSLAPDDTLSVLSPPD